MVLHSQPSRECRLYPTTCQDSGDPHHREGPKHQPPVVAASTLPAPACGETMEPDKSTSPSKLTLLARAYPKLIRDFARDHRFITTGLLTTVAAHVAYAVWGKLAHPSEAPLDLGILVAAGYAGVLVGAAQAFIRERRKGR